MFDNWREKQLQKDIEKWGKIHSMVNPDYAMSKEDWQKIGMKALKRALPRHR